MLISLSLALGRAFRSRGPAASLGDALLMEDGTSVLLLEDGTSQILLEA